MADLSKTIDIIFNSIDNATGNIRNINSGIASFETHVTNVTGPIADLTTSVLKYEAVVLGLAAAYAGFSIGAAANFESAQISLAKVLSGDANSVTAAMKEASTEAINLSERYGISSSVILEGMAKFKQSGFTAKEAAILQKDAMDLVIAGGVNATTATNLLTRSLIGFKASAEDAGRFTEALNNVSNKYNTNLELLALGMSKISPIASLMNFSFEETTGLLTPIIEVFGTGREAAIALKTGLLKLVDDSPKVQQALADLGVSQFDLNGEMRSGRDIFFDVAKSFETLNEKQKIAFTSQIVGIEQAGRMSVVFGNLALVNEVTATAMAKTGSVAKEVGLRLDSTTVQVNRTVQGFSNLSAEIGEKMLPGFDDANEGIRALQKSFRLVVQEGGLSPIFDAINEEGADFEIFLREIAEALPEAFTVLNFDGIIESFSKLKDAISGLFGDVDLTTPEGLAETLQNVLDFIELMITATSGVVRGFEPFIEGLTTILEKLSEFNPEDQEFIGFLAGTITGIDKIIPILGFFASALALLGTAITAVISLRLITFLVGWGNAQKN
jgi:TP901 family phage tail tape measure protein